MLYYNNIFNLPCQLPIGLIPLTLLFSLEKKKASPVSSALICISQDII